MSDDPREVFSLSEALDVLGDDEELLLEMGGILLGQLPEDVAELQSAVRAEDAGRINRAAHRIKGAIASLGGGVVAASALRIERAGGAGDVAAARETLPAFEREIELFRTQLSAHLARMSSNTTA